MSKKHTVDTDEKKINAILERSIAQILPSEKAFRAALAKGERLRIYFGADATGPELHLGHTTNFLLLEKLRQLGHEIIILFGDFTTLIGDPSGKEVARQQRTKEEVEKNMQTWKAQASAIISFSDTANPAKILKNSTWLSKLSFTDITDIASHFTVQHMIERDMFKKRLRAQKPIYMHEFLYPLMQGYDSVAMDVDVEIGGTDQMFNMLVGRTLQKKYNNKEKFVIVTTLLENPKTGKKLMSKSEGSYIALSDSPEEMFGKTMALPDEIIIDMFTDTTRISLLEIEQIKKTLLEGANPRDSKMRLAREITTMYHGEAAAKRAEENFITMFRDRGVPDNIREVFVSKESLLYEAVKDIVRSKTELRRLVNEGAVSIISPPVQGLPASNLPTRDAQAGAQTGGEKIADVDFEITKDMIIKIGKRRFVKVTIK